MVGGYNRDVSRRKALRKRRMAHGWYDNLHQYSKNKIHCSCYLCSKKTASKSWKHSDAKKLAAMDAQVAEME